jgi:hypothetical protein
MWKRWWFWVVAVLALLIIAGIASGSNKPRGEQASESPSASSPPSSASSETTAPNHTPSTPPSARTISDGTWVVGKEVKPGTYRAPDAGSDCYWERVKDFRGGLNSIIANDNGIGDGAPLLITIEKTDKGFTTQDCGDWTSDLSRVTASKTSFGDGMFIVDVDIAPGTYRTNAPSGCYWERLRDFSGGLNSITANDLPKGSTIVEIRSTDRGFKSADCGTWKKV